MKSDEKNQWGDMVKGQMSKAGLSPEKDKFVFLTGSEYMKPLEKFIPADNVEKPMEGKRMGERLSWLNTQVKKLQEFVKHIKNMIYEIVKR
jgi:hypothetical protein